MLRSGETHDYLHERSDVREVTSHQLLQIFMVLITSRQFRKEFRLQLLSDYDNTFRRLAGVGHHGHITESETRLSHLT